MKERRCDVLSCASRTSEKNPGAQWIRFKAAIGHDGTNVIRRPLDACGPEHAHELVDEIGEQTS